MPAGDYGNLRYSTLDTIKTTNVLNLHVITTFSTGIPHGHEGQPLVFGNTMYVVTPFPNNLIAVDLTKPGGAVKWIYEPHPDSRAVGIACCDVVNRGASYGDGKIVYSLLDATVVAVDAETGQGGLAHQSRRHQQGRDVHRGADRRQGPRPGGQLGRRARRSRLRGLSRRPHRQGAVARVQHRPGRRREDRSDVSCLLREGSGEGSRRHVVAVRAMEAGWIHGVGMDLVRPGDESVLLRHGESGRLESRSAAWRQQVVVHDLRARCRHRRGEVGLSGDRARLLGLRRDHGERARRHGLRRPAAEAARPSRPHRLRLRPRSRDRRAALRRDLPADQLGQWLRPENRQGRTRIPPSRPTSER